MGCRGVNRVMECRGYIGGDRAEKQPGCCGAARLLFCGA